MTKQEMLQLKMTATRVRMGIIEATHGGKSGHPGGSLSAADVLTYLYFKEMQIDPQNPQDPDRDRFVLSKGHAAPGLYSVLAERGFFPVADLPTLRRSGSYLQGHPNMNETPGVDMSTGSLGQGVSAACGMALGAKHAGKPINVYTILGDGEVEEGECWEAFMFAAHYGLSNLCVVLDRNHLQIDGTIEEVNSPYPIPEKFEAFGFDIDDDAVALSLDNAHKAGIKSRIHIEQADISKFHQPENSVVICNPPYGERLLELREAESIYRTMGKVLGKGGSRQSYIISPHEQFESFFGMNAKKRRKLYNGMIKCQLYMYF